MYLILKKKVDEKSQKLHQIQYTFLFHVVSVWKLADQIRNQGILKRKFNKR